MRCRLARELRCPDAAQRLQKKNAQVFIGKKRVALCAVQRRFSFAHTGVMDSALSEVLKYRCTSTLCSREMQCLKRCGFLFGIYFFGSAECSYITLRWADIREGVNSDISFTVCEVSCEPCGSSHNMSKGVTMIVCGQCICADWEGIPNATNHDEPCRGSSFVSGKINYFSPDNLIFFQKKSTTVFATQPRHVHVLASPHTPNTHALALPCIPNNPSRTRTNSHAPQPRPSEHADDASSPHNHRVDILQQGNLAVKPTYAILERQK